MRTRLEVLVKVKHAFDLSKCFDDSSFLNLAVTIRCFDSWMENKRLKVNFDRTFRIVVFEIQTKPKRCSVVSATIHAVLATPLLKFFKLFCCWRN